MKKKLISLALALVMVLSLFSVTAFAKDPADDLTITKDGEAAQEGFKGTPGDYMWISYGESTELRICTNGLTVSGTAEQVSISVDEGVTDLTIKDLSISSENVNLFSFHENSELCTLTVEGSNTLSGSRGGSLYFEGSGKITGKGDLTAGGIVSDGDLTLDCSGTVTSYNTYNGIRSASDLTATGNTGKIIVYGEEKEEDEGSYGVTIKLGGTLTVDPSLVMTGSTTYRAPEVEIVGETDLLFDEISEYYIVTTDGEIAKTVLISRGSSEPEPETELPGFIGWIVNSMLRIVKLILARITLENLKPAIIGGAIVKVIEDAFAR